MSTLVSLGLIVLKELMSYFFSFVCITVLYFGQAYFFRFIAGLLLLYMSEEDAFWFWDVFMPANGLSQFSHIPSHFI